MAMKIEHVALNVSDPIEMARWYVENLGMVVKRRMTKSPWTHFLADDSGTVMLELYGNPEVPVPDYREQPALVFHIALVSDDIDADASRLTARGATLDGDYLHTPDGDMLAMLRDPWGIAIQLAKRSNAMV